MAAVPGTPVTKRTLELATTGVLWAPAVGPRAVSSARAARGSRVRAVRTTIARFGRAIHVPYPQDGQSFGFRSHGRSHGAPARCAHEPLPVPDRLAPRRLRRHAADAGPPRLRRG